MAEAKKPSTKKLVVRKKRETVRERADKSNKKSSTSPRARKAASAITRPASKVVKALGREFTPLKVGESKVGKALGRRSRLTPMYFIDSFKELRQVKWPSFRQAMKLMFAVFSFSVCLAALIKGIDLGFDKLFKDVILK